MPKIFQDVRQGEGLWFRIRCGKVTASELHNLITPNWKPTESKKRHAYMCSKLAEKYTGEPTPSGSGWAAEQGHILETDAIPYYELTRDCKIRRVGFVASDDERCGCSPDGLIGEDSGIEIKSLQRPHHVALLLEHAATGKLPTEYAAQVQASLYVTRRPWWVFFAYSRDLPMLEVRVERDEKVMKAIGDVLTAYYADFDAAYQVLESQAA